MIGERLIVIKYYIEALKTNDYDKRLALDLDLGKRKIIVRFTI
jgi:hypothetical protein